MALHLVIDSYNLLMALPYLRSLFLKDPDRAREELLNRLALYRRRKRHPITVVFDGYGGFGPKAGPKVAAGVQVVFTKGGSADSFIAELASRERERLVVVTGDREVQRAVKNAGGVVLGPMDFGEKMETALEDLSLTGLKDEEDGPNGGPGPKGRRLKKRERLRFQRLAKL